MKTDLETQRLIAAEEKRQQETISLIASENYVSPAVREALGSVFTNKYSEGYPGKRYYQGNRYVDQLENLIIERAKNLFKVAHVNCQTYSGSPANLAILAATCQVGDPILSQHLNMGGHLSMGQTASMTSKYYQAFYYGLDKNGDIDWQDLKLKAISHKPKVIFCGGTAFTKIFNFERYAKIADKIGAYFVADISHIAGLVAGGVHPSPANYADIIMTTTHKTLRGPRGALIMITQKGLKKDPELGIKIDKAVFPGLQGGPHNNTLAALAMAVNEAGQPEFKQYAKQIIKNSKFLADELKKYNFQLVGGGTENHLIWLDLKNKNLDGWTLAWALEAAGLVANRQSIPNDPNPPYYPSGLRLGTPAVSTRGMKEKEMIMIAKWVYEVTKLIKLTEERVRFKKEIFKNTEILKIRKEVKSLCQKFPVP